MLMSLLGPFQLKSHMPCLLARRQGCLWLDLLVARLGGSELRRWGLGFGISAGKGEPCCTPKVSLWGEWVGVSPGCAKHRRGLSTHIICILCRDVQWDTLRVQI